MSDTNLVECPVSLPPNSTAEAKIQLPPTCPISNVTEMTRDDVDLRKISAHAKKPNTRLDEGQTSEISAISLGDEWKSTTDKRGRRYFYNRVTRETSWEAPPGLIKVINQICWS